MSNSEMWRWFLLAILGMMLANGMIVLRVPEFVSKWLL